MNPSYPSAVRDLLGLSRLLPDRFRAGSMGWLGFFEVYEVKADLNFGVKC